MKRYEYEIELESPLELNYLYSDEELTAEQIEEMVTDKILNRIDIYRVRLRDREGDETKDMTSEYYDQLAPGI